jgi:hypothetical protein
MESRSLKMWIPASLVELESLVVQGVLEESAFLDFKRELSDKSKDIARDVAAMANEGGVLIIGVGEDEHGRPTILNPVQLVGEAERVTNILRSSVSDPPTIEFRTFTLENDFGRGYLAIIVPPSPRAPHMVVLGGENRFYGRSAKGNIPLNEAEIARLYERRLNRQAEGDAFLDRAIESAPFESSDDFGYLHLVARPSVLVDDLLLRLSEKARGSSFLSAAINLAAAENVFSQTFSPGFSTGSIRPTQNGWIIYMHDQPIPGQRRSEFYALDLEVQLDGVIRLFCGRAAERRNSLLQIFDSGVAETTVRFLTLAGHLYQEAEYWGRCDLGVAVTGISGAVSHTSLIRMDIGNSFIFEEPVYRRTVQIPALSLAQDARTVARSLLARFFHATLGGRFDPLE